LNLTKRKKKLFIRNKLIRDWSKRIGGWGNGREHLKLECGGQKAHDSPLPFSNIIE